MVKVEKSLTVKTISVVLAFVVLVLPMSNITYASIDAPAQKTSITKENEKRLILSKQLNEELLKIKEALCIAAGKTKICI